jgi:putative tryptophan/tyrosine transport system substrate-binding protein
MRRPLRKTALASILFAGALLAVAVTVEAQQPGKIFHIGFLDQSTASGTAVLRDAFRQELSKLGWIEGKNIMFEYRYAENKLDRVPSLVDELVQLKVDVLVVRTRRAIIAAKQATKTIPIVMVTTQDPVATGIIDSLARPGGNITGLTTLNQELSGKRLELRFRRYRASESFGMRRESFGMRRAQTVNRGRLLALRSMRLQRACYRYSLDL